MRPGITELKQMPHKFDPRNIGKLDNPERKKILPPGPILLRLGLAPGNLMADIGAGAGYFSFPAAEIIGDAGKVFALDISKEMTDELKRRVSDSGNRNISVIKTGEYEIPLKKESIDFVLICTVLHEVEDKTLFLKNAGSALKRGGVLAVIEWKKLSQDQGPPAEDRIDSGEFKGILEGSGFHDHELIDFNGYFYIIRCIK